MTINFGLGVNWKTSVSGLIAAGGAFVLFAAAPPYSVHFPTWITAAAGFIAAGGLAAMGFAAKDSNVTGGSVVQPGIPVAPVPAPPGAPVQGVAGIAVPAKPLAPPLRDLVEGQLPPRVPGSKW